MEDLKSGLKEKLMADKKILLLIVVGIFGMLLLVLPDAKRPNKQDDNEKEENRIDIFSQYEKELEEKIIDLLSGISGVSDVKILLTLDCYEEYVYASDEEYRENNSSENSNIEEKKSYIIIDDDKHKGKGGMFIKLITPRVRGVGVVCRGAESAVIRREISSILCSALDIGASNVHITS